MKKVLDICVISDCHLGADGCHAEELLAYLSCIEPARMILNGNIIDAGTMTTKYFPATHWKIVERLVALANSGTMVYYITGNHDDVLRRFNAFDLGNIRLRNQLELRIQNKSYWFFHGDVFDAPVFISSFLALLGGTGYDMLVRIKAWINRLRLNAGWTKIAFAHRLKRPVRPPAKSIADFETQAIRMGIKKGMDGVVCGHIHHPRIDVVTQYGREITYMNSGDWIENLTALEYIHGKWSLFKFEEPMDPGLQDYLQKIQEDQYIFNPRRQKAKEP